MLSIIISTYKPNIFVAVSKNIAATIGIPHEIIKIENPGTIGLTDAYNLGARQAKFKNLLFLHDDVAFQTINWGKLLVEHLKNPKTGVVGIAGSNYVPKAPAGWYTKGVHEIEALQKKDIRKKAIILDGVFLAITKENFEKIKFSEDVKGYHGYDTDFCLKAAKFFQNYKVFDIQLEHFSSGNPNQQYLENNIKIREKYGFNFQSEKNIELEKEAFLAFIKSYFVYHKINFKNLKFTLKYFPENLNLSQKKQIYKTYFSLIKNYKDYNRRIVQK